MKIINDGDEQMIYYALSEEVARQLGASHSVDISKLLTAVMSGINRCQPNPGR